MIQDVLCEENFSVHCCENSHRDGNNENMEVFMLPSDQSKDSGVKVSFKAKHTGPGNEWNMGLPSIH